MFLKRFLLLLTKFWLWRGDWALGYHCRSFDFGGETGRWAITLGVLRLSWCFLILPSGDGPGGSRGLKAGRLHYNALFWVLVFWGGNCETGCENTIMWNHASLMPYAFKGGFIATDPRSQHLDIPGFITGLQNFLRS